MEVYIKSYKGEYFFFYRKDKISEEKRKKWQKNCDKIAEKIEKNNTFIEFLDFLKIDKENSVILKINSVDLKIWKNEKYELIEFKTTGTKKYFFNQC